MDELDVDSGVRRMIRAGYSDEYIEDHLGVALAHIIAVRGMAAAEPFDILSLTPLNSNGDA